MLEVVEAHRASNVNVRGRGGEGQGERFPDVRQVDLHGKMKLDRSDPASGAIGNSRDMGPTCEHVTDLVDSV